jgi:hypothetical protein
MFRNRHKIGNFTTLEDAQKALYEHKKENNHPDVTRDFIEPRQALSAVASRDREDAERYRYIRSTAFREFETGRIWLRFAAIEQYEGPSRGLTLKSVDDTVDAARDFAARRENKP